MNEISHVSVKKRHRFWLFKGPVVATIYLTLTHYMPTQGAPASGSGSGKLLAYLKKANANGEQKGHEYCALWDPELTSYDKEGFSFGFKKKQCLE